MTKFNQTFSPPWTQWYTMESRGISVKTSRERTGPGANRKWEFTHQKENAIHKQVIQRIFLKKALSKGENIQVNGFTLFPRKTPQNAFLDLTTTETKAK